MGFGIYNTKDPMFCRSGTMDREDPDVAEPIGGVTNITPEVFVRSIIADTDKFIR
jgi:hypothetical protein